MVLLTLLAPRRRHETVDLDEEPGAEGQLGWGNEHPVYTVFGGNLH